MSEEGFLSRWSRLKRSGGAPEEPAVPASGPMASLVPSAAEAAALQPAPTPAPLPPVESLEPGADISLFMRAEIEQGLKRQALKKLLQDPRFNVMDGLDVYIDDYSKPDPLPAGWLEKMNQSLRLGEYREPDAPPAEQSAAGALPPAPSQREDAGASPAEPSAQAAAETEPEPSSREKESPA